MSRTVETWIGKTDDTQAPPRVRLRVFDRCQGRCGICDRKITAGESWTLEHIIALVNGGPNSEDNLDITCRNCLAAKNEADIAEKAKVNRIRSKHIGIKASKSRPMAGSKNSRFKKHMDGSISRR